MRAVAPLPRVTMMMTAATPMMMPSDGEPRAQEIVADLAQRDAQAGADHEGAASVASSRTMRPSMNCTLRLAKRAISGSCVTSMMVMPDSRLKADKSAMISRERWLSRLPVGSSAKSSKGSAAMRAGDRDPLLLAAGKLGRRVAFAPFETHALERERGPRAALRGLEAAIDERQLHVLERRRAPQKIEALEHEAQIVAAQKAALVARQAAHIDALEEVAAGGGRIEAAHDVHRGRFARARGAHDRDELAFLNREIDIVECADLGFGLAVDLGDA